MTLRVDKKLRTSEALLKLVGKTISGVVVAHHEDGHPCSRMFIMFSDDSAFELWTEEEDLSIASELDDSGAERLVELLSRREKTQVRVIRAPHEDPDSIQRDLLADSSR